ncbi:MAG: hypothetical protein ACJ8F7_13055 [Gemmataceae bacterium]
MASQQTIVSVNGEARRPAHPPARFTLFTALLWLQGSFYLVTGLWPLIDLVSFEQLTGPKTDHWLVQTVGVLVAAVGLTLLVGACRRRNPPELAVLAVACALGLTGIDVVYVSRHVILPVYLADAAVEAVLILAWTFALVQRRD